MEQNTAMISKKIWKIVKVALFMIRKGLCKKKLLVDLNTMMKRGKIARKALGNLMFHNYNNHHFFASRGGGGDVGDAPSNHHHDNAREYEFSCSNTPLYRHYFNKRKNQHHQNENLYYLPSPFPLEDCENNVNIEEFSNMLDMMLRNDEGTGGVSAASPALPGLGFGRSPGVRQLRIMDSPYMDQGNKHVDQAAEVFIKNFYSQLKLQN